MTTPTVTSDRYRTPTTVVRRNLILLLVSVSLTVILLRLWLHHAPESDFNVGAYNIHHLFTGLILITIGGIPLALFRGSTQKLDLCLLIFGVGLGLALDEWVYLIATDGSNASYLLPVSLWGAVVVVGAACLYAAVLGAWRIAQAGCAERTELRRIESCQPR